MNNLNLSHAMALIIASANVIPAAATVDCIRDNATQLTWDIGSTSNVTYYQAANFAHKLNAARWCGFNDWRLPSLVELQELEGAWTATETGLVWSKTLVNQDHTRAWVVDFAQNKSITQPLTQTATVRLVRGMVVGERTWQLNSGRSVRANGALAYSVVSNAKSSADSSKQILKAAGTWSAAGTMSVTRNDHTATRLPTGQILIAGGYDDATGGYLNSAELYNPSTNVWATISPMAVARQFHTATLLKNGKVLVIGGSNDDEGILASAELYSPNTSTWANISAMPVARAGHTATLLSNGKVLVAGGFNGEYLDSAMVYDAVTGAWSATSNMVEASSGHTATVLNSGKVLIAGGCNSTICGIKTAQLYNSNDGTWSAAATMGSVRSFHAATLLDDGTVLVSGGYSELFSTHLKSAERYDPITNTWSATGDMGIESQNHSLTLLPQGQVLVVGGETNSTFNSTRAELYDTTTGTFSAIDPMSTGRDTNTATWLANSCKVLVTGGYDSADAEIYTPDTVSVIVTPSIGLTTTEAAGSGHTTTFTVKLAAAPTTDVTIDLFSTDLTEGTVAPASLTFTDANWNVTQTVTITGVNDGSTDGNVAYSIVGSYTGVNLLDVAVTNIDDDVRAVVVTPAAGLTTTEIGGTATFTVKLGNAPSGNVTIGLSSSDLTEGTVSPASLTFTTSNWSTAQPVTITGVNDSIDDGNIIYTIVTTVAGGGYDGINAVDVAVTNNDDDTRGVTVNPTSGLITTEVGGTATFTVKLNTQPTTNVTIGLTSSDTTEGTVAPVKLTFTTSNWNTPQTVRMTGVDDTNVDGNVAYQIITTAAGGDYANFNVADVAVSNTDNDAKGLTVIPTSGLVTTENGGTDTFTVQLNTPPTANVTIGLSSSNTAEGTVAPTSLIFTPTSWNIPKLVTVTGVNDNIIDSNISYTIRTDAATGGDYAGINGPDVSVTNNDNDSTLITVSALSGTDVTEAAGTTHTRTFTVKLGIEPTAPVSIGLSSSDLTEGKVTPATLYFTIANYNIAQTVTVTGVDDFVDDGDVTFSIVTAPAVGGNYAGANAIDVTVVNTDNDARGATIAPTTGLVTTEAGGIATFTMKLNSEPTADVEIGLTSSKPTEGTVEPTSLNFTPVNWATPQTVTVTGVDDVMVDGNIAYNIVTAVAVGGDYGTANFNANDVNITNNDNDTRGIAVTLPTGLTSLTLTEANTTTTATFTVKLNTAPTADVKIDLTSSDTTEGTVSPPSLTFTTSNYATNQTVTVTRVNDAIDDGDITFSIITALAVSSDVNYNNINANDVAVTTTDDDVRWITVTPTTGLVTTESGGTATFTVKLNSEPTADVTIPISSSGVTEGTVAPTSLTFTPSNWNTAQTLTVTGVADGVDDGNVMYAIVTAPAVGGDYTNVDAANVSVRNMDINTRGVVVSNISDNTTETGGTATFTMQLNTKPTANVIIALSSADVTEGTVSPASLTFTPGNAGNLVNGVWQAAPQTVNVKGVADNLDDGNVTYTIVTGAVTGVSDYVGINPADVTVVNVDNNTGGVTVSSISGNTTEAGGTATFTVHLNTPPTGDVSIALSSADTTEGTVSPASLTFTPSNYAIDQTVTVKGVNDFVDDGDITYTVVTGAPSGGGYTGVDTANVTVVNIDDDTRGATVVPITGLVTTEAGGQATFTVKLNSQPTANVVIGLSTADTSEGTVSPASLTFNVVNWSSPQLVTVTGVDDSVKDGGIVYTITTGAANGGDYVNVTVANVSATNLDDSDFIVVTPSSGLTTTEAGGTATFTVKLSTAPTANVTIALSSSDTTEGTVSPSNLTFTPSNWSTARTVTVTGESDDSVDGPISYKIALVYAGMTTPDAVTITNIDKDGINVTPITGLTTTEGAGTAIFDVVLGTRPSANVSIGLSSSDTTEGAVFPTSITFTNGNWNTKQTVTVTGVNDNIDDGDIVYTIKTAAATSNDGSYKNYNAMDVVVTNIDDEKTNQTITFSTAPTVVVGGMGTVNATATSGLAVTFTSATTGICTVTGSTVTGVAVGTCTINANQAGNANYNAAPQVTQNITVKNNQTIAFGTAPTVVVGGTGTVNATATSGLAVVFTSATTGICTVSGSTVTGVAVGTCTINANQAGNANYNAAPQVTQNITVSKANQTITFSTTPTVVVGGMGTVNATATSGLAVTFTSATTGICTVTGSTVTGVAAGTCTINANQAGNANYNAAPQVTQNITVKNNQTIAFGTAPTVVVGGTGTVSATATSGLTVTFTSDTTSICTVVGSTVTGVAVGTCTINANQAGNANYNAAPQVTQNITVGKGSQTITFGTAPTVVVSGTGTVTATGGASGLPVTFTSTTTGVCTISGSTVSGVTAGTCTIAANQAGNANYNAAPQVTQNITVGKGSQTITFGTAPTVVVSGTGTVTATGGASGLPVTFTSTTTGVCTISGSTVSGVTAGTCTIAANQAGNANYDAAPQVTQNITVGKGSQTITFGTAPTVVVGGTGTVSATATSGLTVAFTSATTGICTVSGSTVTGVAVGTCTINANQTGNANYNAAPQVTQNNTVGKGSQTITFGTAPTVVVGGTGTVSATATSGLTVAFTSATTGICTVVGSTVTGVAVGTCTINANQTGNANYNAAPQVTQNITVKNNQTITFGTVPTVVVGGTTTTVSATATSGLAVTFTSKTISKCTVSGSTITVVAAGTCTIAANQAGNANYNAATEVTQNINFNLFNNGFEGTAPDGWAQTDTSGTTGTWSIVTASANPVASPHGGTKLANFNSFSATSGNKTLYYRSTGFAIASSYSTVTLKFWMYHDSGNSAKNDNIQVQISINNGSTWTNVGSAVLRYSATAGWTETTLDLSTYKNNTVSLGFLGTIAKGGNMSIDDITVTAQ